MAAKQLPMMQRGESSTILGQRYSFEIAVDLVADTPSVLGCGRTYPLL